MMFKNDKFRIRQTQMTMVFIVNEYLPRLFNNDIQMTEKGKSRTSELVPWVKVLGSRQC